MTDNNDDDDLSERMKIALEASSRVQGNEDERTPAMRILDACALISASVQNIQTALKEIH